MTLKSKFFSMLMVMTLLGCRGSIPASAASGANGEGRAAAATGGGTRTEYILDPTFNNMKAFAVTIPAGWHFEGAMFQGGSCESVPFPVFRTSSPDGLSYVERLPLMSWQWGSGPVGPKNRGDCLPLTKGMGAQEFLHYLAATLHVEYVADVPVPAALNAEMEKAAKGLDQNHTSGLMAGMTMSNSSEAAAAEVRFMNGSFKMRGLLKVKVDCHLSHFPGRKPMFAMDRGMAPSEVNQCTAGVRYLATPEAKFNSVRAMWDGPALGAQPDAEWFQRYMQRQQQQASAMLSAQMDRNNKQMQAQQANFQQSQAVRQHMHEEFLSTMQRGTDMSMARTGEAMNARSTATSDWVDYALDRRTVLDPNTGQISKVSSAYSYTWMDNTGKVSYQTNDPNANPNGVLQGNWTKQAVVHGDGSQ